MTIMVFHKPRLLTESLPIIKSDRVTLTRNTAVKWKRTVEFNSELKNQLNKHAAEQSEKLSDLKELQSMLFHKNYYTGLN